MQRRALVFVLLGALILGSYTWFSRDSDGEVTDGTMTMEQVFQRLTEAGLLDAFYLQTSMEPPGPDAFILEGLTISERDEVTSYERIADDGAGGAFVQLASGTIVLVGSEGEAMRLGADLEEALALLLSVASWRDATGALQAIDVETARAERIAYMTQWGLPLEPENAVELALIRGLFGLAEPEDSFGAFYDVVQLGSDLQLSGPDGVFVRIGRDQ